MTTLVQDIQALLTTLAPAGGVWYGINTAEPAVFPYIVWQRVISVPNVVLSGATDMQNTRVQIDIYSRQVSELAAMETALETAMEASGLINIPLSSEDLYEFDVRAWRVIKDYSLWARN